MFYPRPDYIYTYMNRTGFFLLLIIFLQNACSNKPAVDAAPTMLEEGATTIERSVIDTIMALQEVKQRAHFIENETKEKRHLAVFIASEPDSVNSYYWIKVGEDNGDAFATHFNFFVYPDSMCIMYYDVVEDAEVSLEEWRDRKDD